MYMYVCVYMKTLAIERQKTLTDFHFQYNIYFYNVC